MADTLAPPAPLRERVSTPRTRAHAWLRIDWVVLVVAGAVSGLGLLMIYSTTHVAMEQANLGVMYYVQRQGIALGIGLLLAAIAFAVDYRRLRELWPLLYGLTLPLLAAVRFVGHNRGGTTAWFNIGPLQFQPSELAKLTLIVALAGYCQQHAGELDAWHLFQALALAGVPMGLVMLQNDLGTMLVMGVCVVAMLVVAGLRPLHLLVLFLLAVTLVAGLAMTGTFSGYRADRFLSFLDQPGATTDLRHATEAEYSLAQAKLAISHGGLTGQGYLHGTLTQIPDAVPAQRTDFIFTAVGEELGFLGAGLLLLAYALLAWRGWRTAVGGGDLFGSLIAVGIVAMFTFQVFENVGMTMGIMPITGIPLPFMSYGGSAVIAYWIAIGLLLNVHFRRFAR